ncbi:uncharacterized protein [Medicago truncatula]|uniref:uncharacterized protein n=1 Tax=Medicago truncatula TaxID=3880 RepID=UPI001967F47A|nr:uncharacterized protein LOC112422860 [Medicago truncatula]
MVRNSIRKEIGNAKFCILIDEAQDESKKEQMAVILRFVDGDGLVQERFFDVVHVNDTSAMTLKNELVSVLSRFNLEVENIRGQGYDGASNMRASREVVHIHELFTQLTLVVNIVTASSKRHDQLQAAQEINITNMIANDELQTGKGANQVGAIRRGGDTRWSSHFQSICSLMKMYDAVCTVIDNVIDERATYSQIKR